MSKGIMFFLLSLTVLFSSCGALSYNYYGYKNVKVKGNPMTDFYVKNNKSWAYSDGFEAFGANSDVSSKKKDRDIVYIGSTDETGAGVLKLSTQDYNKSKKRVTAVKSGYEAEDIKLKKRFNPSTLWNMLIPGNLVILAFDKKTVLNDKKVNEFTLTKKSTISCFEYYDMALNSKNDKEKHY